MPSIVAVPFPSNHSILNCPPTGAEPSTFIVIDPFGVAPVQFVLLIVEADVTAGLICVSLIVKGVTGDLQLVVALVAWTK